jgi:hypothetical protein
MVFVQKRLFAASVVKAILDFDTRFFAEVGVGLLELLDCLHRFSLALRFACGDEVADRARSELFWRAGCFLQILIGLGWR